MKNARITMVAAGVLLTAGLGAGTAVAATSSSSTPKPCQADDVSFYFGGDFAGMLHRSFQITLLAHPGVTCTLSDKPLLSVGNAKGQTDPVALHIGGRGGTLTLTPALPLHTQIDYSYPDAPSHGTDITSLKLKLPGGGYRATYFDAPGPQPVYIKNGITVSSWLTGIGAGQGESDE